jgi:hypothetical protein
LPVSSLDPDNTDSNESILAWPLVWAKEGVKSWEQKTHMRSNFLIEIAIKQYGFCFSLFSEFVNPCLPAGRRGVKIFLNQKSLIFVLRSIFCRGDAEAQRNLLCSSVPMW